MFWFERKYRYSRLVSIHFCECSLILIQQLNYTVSFKRSKEVKRKERQSSIQGRQVRPLGQVKNLKDKKDKKKCKSGSSKTSKTD